MANNRQTTLELPIANIDNVIDHRGMYGNESLCRVRIFGHALADVALITELSDHPGESLTNCIENIAGIVAKQYELNPEKTLWIEHQPPNDRDRFEPRQWKETFELVEMKYDSALELLIGKKHGNRIMQTPFKYPKRRELTPVKALGIILTGKLD